MLNSFNILLIHTNSILFQSFVKISEQSLVYYAKNRVFNLKESKSKDTKNRFLGAIMGFSEVLLVSFLMLNNKKRHLE